MIFLAGVKVLTGEVGDDLRAVTKIVHTVGIRSFAISSQSLKENAYFRTNIFLSLPDTDMENVCKHLLIKIYSREISRDSFCLC